MRKFSIINNLDNVFNMATTAKDLLSWMRGCLEAGDSFEEVLFKTRKQGIADEMIYDMISYHHSGLDIYEFQGRPRVIGRKQFIQ